MIMTSPRKTSTETNRGARPGTREGFVLTVVTTGELAAVTIPNPCQYASKFRSYSIVAAETTPDIFQM
jgi:hypothetical protein